MSTTHRTLMHRPRCKIEYKRRSRDEHMGRFGGGWQWSLGIEAGPVLTQARERRPATVMLNGLVCMVRITLFPRPPARTGLGGTVVELSTEGGEFASATVRYPHGGHIGAAAR